MNPNDFSILFMDDEVHDETVATVSEAVKALREVGYDVDVKEKMSDAIDAFYKKFYHVFILDIDMQKVKDLLFEGSGSNVAGIYRSLDNGSSVIMYSAMGTVEDWFDVTNRHIFGYVFKGSKSPVRKLLEMVEKAAFEYSPLMLPDPKTEGQVLIAETDSERISDEDMKSAVLAAGNFEPVFCKMEKMPEMLENSDYATAIIVEDQFSTMPDDMALLKKICMAQPSPNVIIGCEGKSECQESIIELINLRPFRLINLMKENPGRTFEECVKSAAGWYGGNETFQADTKYVHRAAKDIEWEELEKRFETEEWESEEILPGEKDE
jgi:hypothetical protein